MKPSHGNYRPDIDGLRGIAVLLVVAYHAFPRVARSGFVGVDVFFVISGFLISTNIFRDLAAGSFSIIDFYARRCRRIVPALVVVLVAVAAAAWFVLPGVEFTRLGRHLFAGATFSSNIVLLHDAGYFDSASALKPFLHLWSLGIEEQFYVVWPLLAMVVGRRRRSLALLVLGLFVGSFAINVSWSTSYPARDFYLLPSRFWELLLGCALALPSIAARSFGTRLAGVAAAASVALSIASVVLVASTSVFPGVWALLPTSATVFAIAAGPTAWWNRKVLANRVLVAIGLVSYPLYLWHWPLLAILRTVAPDPSIAATLVALAIAAMLAIATWRFIEGPLQRRASRLRRPRVVVVSSALALIAIAAIGLLVYTDRVPARDQLEHPLAYALQRYALYNIGATRVGHCFVDTSRAFDGFDRDCYAGDIALLGDSHAAHLYQGLAEVIAAHGHTLAQLDASSCPPVFSLDASYPTSCRRANGAIADYLRQHPPHIVVLHAEWTSYLSRAGFTDALTATLGDLSRIGVAHIVVIGPLPAWSPTLPAVLETEFVRRGMTIPERVDTDVARLAAADAELRSIVHGAGAVYLAPSERLCDARGCLALVGADVSTDLIAYDSDHLTRPGARYLARTLVEPALAPWLR